MTLSKKLGLSPDCVAVMKTQSAELSSTDNSVGSVFLELCERIEGSATELAKQDNQRQVAQAPNCRRSRGGESMTTYVNGPHNDGLEIRNNGPACTEGRSRTPEKRVPVGSGPLTHERVVAEIVRAITICTSCSGRELNGETNLALDLGLESMSRVELLAEIECALDITLDGVEVAVFAELTIAELADIYMPALQEDSTDRLRNLA